MTATERLRELLDERGVEWREPVQMEGSIFTRWNSDGVSWTASMVHGRNNALRIGASTITPEQAIAATLGSGTIEKAAERIEVLSGLAREYLHRYGMLMSMAGENVTDEVLAIESVINEVCGKKAVDE